MTNTLNKNVRFDDLSGIRRDYLSIAFVTGCFDLLHPEHLNCLEFCAAQIAREGPSALVVGIGDDDTVRMLKGEGRPIFSLLERLRMLAALEVVDYITVCSGGPMGHEPAMKMLHPNIYIVPCDDRLLEAKRLLAERCGSRFITRQENKGLSTSKIIAQIREGRL